MTKLNGVPNVREEGGIELVGGGLKLMGGFCVNWVEDGMVEAADRSLGRERVREGYEN